MSEEWRPVPGFGGHYIVSSQGRVARIMKCRVTTNGYRYAALSNRCKQKLFMVHQLVAQAFIGPARRLWIHHRDNNKTNNVLENLEYVTPKENTRRAFQDGLIGIRENHHSAKLTWDQVRLIRELCASGKHSQKAIAQKFMVSTGTVGDIHRKKIWREQ